MTRHSRHFFRPMKWRTRINIGWVAYRLSEHSEFGHFCLKTTDKVIFRFGHQNPRDDIGATHGFICEVASWCSDFMKGTWPFDTCKTNLSHFALGSKWFISKPRSILRICHGPLKIIGKATHGNYPSTISLFPNVSQVL